MDTQWVTYCYPQVDNILSTYCQLVDTLWSTYCHLVVNLWLSYCQLMDTLWIGSDFWTFSKPKKDFLKHSFGNNFWRMNVYPNGNFTLRNYFEYLRSIYSIPFAILIVSFVRLITEIGTLQIKASLKIYLHQTSS